MSIRKNNKQVAGNYTYINIKEYSSLIDNSIQNVVNTGNSQIENINTNSTKKILEMNNILNNVESTGNEKIEEMNLLINDIKQFIKLIGANTVGSEKVWRGTVAPENYVFMDGQEVSREEYIDLFNWVVENNLIIEDSIWKDYKKYGLYSYGDGETTFRLPNMTGYYLVGYDPNHHTELAVEQSDMLPNITGNLTLQGTNDSSLIGSSNATGVFNINTKEASAYPITGSTTLTDELVDTIDFDLSREFNTGDRVQPRSIPVKYIVCYKNILEYI